jgi:hypothetical protein
LYECKVDYWCPPSHFKQRFPATASYVPLNRIPFYIVRDLSHAKRIQRLLLLIMDGHSPSTLSATPLRLAAHPATDFHVSWNSFYNVCMKPFLQCLHETPSTMSATLVSNWCSKRKPVSLGTLPTPWSTLPPDTQSCVAKQVCA